MTKQTKLGGSFTLPGTPIKLVRMGYGAMQLAGPEIWGPPRDVDAAIAVLREAVASGVNHIDTSDYYGPHVTNQIIKKALHPYPNKNYSPVISPVTIPSLPYFRVLRRFPTPFTLLDVGISWPLTR
jgi:aryl-alcohol dehydrogenase-like predicted oxidoreductase